MKVTIFDNECYLEKWKSKSIFTMNLERKQITVNTLPVCFRKQVRTDQCLCFSLVLYLLSQDFDTLYTNKC